MSKGKMSKVKMSKGRMPKLKMSKGKMSKVKYRKYNAEVKKTWKIDVLLFEIIEV
jgi:hypothetical protein